MIDWLEFDETIVAIQKIKIEMLEIALIRIHILLLRIYLLFFKKLFIESILFFILTLLSKEFLKYNLLYLYLNQYKLNYELNCINKDNLAKLHIFVDN